MGNDHLFVNDVSAWPILEQNFRGALRETDQSNDCIDYAIAWTREAFLQINSLLGIRDSISNIPELATVEKLEKIAADIQQYQTAVSTHLLAQILVARVELFNAAPFDVRFPEE